MKLSKRTLWVWKDPPGKVDPPPEASFASSSARTARSVNSDGQSRVIEPRKSYLVGVFVVAIAGTMSERRQWIGRQEPTGVREQGKGQKRSQGTWETQPRPWDKMPGRMAPAYQHPKLAEVGWPAARSQLVQPTQGIWRNVTNGAAGEARGSLNGFIVPFESRRTEPWEPGSREGNRLVGAAAGQRGQDTEPVTSVHETDAGGDGRLFSTGRTVCPNRARTGLWGSRRATAGSTRSVSQPRN